MKFIRSFTLSIGVTLCVAPIFNSALAQQGDSQARLLLEIQALRGEIAELRDMVERQQHQLQRMQSGQRSAPAPSTAPVSYVPAQLPAGVPMATSDEAADSSADGASQRAGGEGSTSVDGAFYRPYDEPKDSSVSAVASPAVAPSTDQVGVEERIITAPPIVQEDHDRGYPPVEDRSIGDVQNRSGTVPVKAPGDSSALETDQPSYRQPPVSDQADVAAASSSAAREPASYNEPIATTDQQAAPGTTVGQPSVGSQTSPVIAIPRSAVTNRTAQQPPTGASQATQPGAQSSVVQPPLEQPKPIQTELQPGQAPVLSEQEYYTQGFNLVKQSQFRDAIEVFKQLIAQHPQGTLVGDAHYWIGESSFLARDLDVSKRYFKAFIGNYPQSARVPGAMLRTAYIEQEQGNEIEARILLNEIIQFYPSSDAVHAAKNRLADIENKPN